MAHSVDINGVSPRIGVNTNVYSILHERKVFAPFFKGLYCTQYIRHNTIGPFCLEIGLGMIRGRHVKLAIKHIKHMTPKS